jgi:hypothetical protein
VVKKKIATPPTCETQRTRKNFIDLIQQDGTLNAEGQDFIDAVLCLSGTAGTFGSKWDDFTRTHREAASIHHGNVATFLPWHRLLLISLENE